MKRDRNDNEEGEKPPYMEKLKPETVELVFDILSLEEKRELIPKLLKSARIIHGLFIDPIPAKFKTWLCRGEEKSFTEEEVEKVWQIWGYIKAMACYAAAEYNEEELRDDFYICNVRIKEGDKDKHYSESCGRFGIDSADDNKWIDKESYFEWLLEHTVPEQVRVSGWDEPEYFFPDLDCNKRDCNCNMEPDGMRKFHHWDISNSCPYQKTKEKNEER